jgi:hypothetical protein
MGKGIITNFKSVGNRKKGTVGWSCATFNRCTILILKFYSLKNLDNQIRLTGIDIYMDLTSLKLDAI